MTQLYYDNKIILSGQATPLVSREDSIISYGERWADAQTITLRGSITGCAKDGFADIINQQQNLINVFSKDFQNFSIIEEGVTIFSKDYCILQGGVQFSSSNYVGKVDYTIPILCYPSGYFSGVYGVLDPSNTWEFNETNDKKLTATHKISARGFNSSSSGSDALQNARNFCYSKSGSYDISPFFIVSGSGVPICLKKIVERPNRFNGTFGLELYFEGDLAYRSGVMLRYSSDYVCDTQNGTAKLNLIGSLEGCYDAGMDAVRSRYSGFDILGTARSEYYNVNGLNDLNSEYLSSGISESPFQRRLSFNVSFDNYTGSNAAFLDYSISLNSGEDSIVTANVEGEIKARGDIKSRWTKVQNFYSSGINLYTYANEAYSSAYGSYYPLNQNPSSSGVTMAPFAAQIKIQAQFDNKENELSGNIARINYGETFGPAVTKVMAVPLLSSENGGCGTGYSVTDLRYANRVSYGINGDFTLVCGGSITGALSQIRDFARQKFLAQCPSNKAAVETSLINTGYYGGKFDFLWSAQSPNLVTDTSSSYTLIDNLSII